MNIQILDNAIFRSIYCYLAGGNQECISRGYSPGIFASSFDWLAFILAGFVLVFFVINAFLVGLLVMTWAERRLIGRFQRRPGPNRWGPLGLFTPFADAIKILFKEDILPDESHRFLYVIAPVMVMVPVLMVWAVMPIGASIFVANINVGLLFVLSITSVSVLGIIAAGWSSGNRISMFSAIRAVALLISYEIPAALAVLGIVLLTGSLSLIDIVKAQDVPFIIVQPLGFLVFFIASLAETNRTPFDLTEAESELASGHLNDYSSMKFGILFITEYAATITAATLITTLFLGGWRGFDFIPSPIWFILKTFLVLVAIIWIRVSWPRLRIDQMLDIAWKGLFELTLVNIVVTAVLVYLIPPTGGNLWIIAAANWVFVFPAIWLVDKLLRGSGKQSNTIDKSKLSVSAYPVAPIQN